MYVADETVSIGGPDVLTRKEIAALAFTVSGKTPRIMHVRPGRMLAAATLAGFLHPRIAQLMEFAVNVSTTDCIAPCTGRQRLVDYFTSRVQGH